MSRCLVTVYVEHHDAERDRRVHSIVNLHMDAEDVYEHLTPHSHGPLRTEHILHQLRREGQVREGTIERFTVHLLRDTTPTPRPSRRRRRRERGRSDVSGRSDSRAVRCRSALKLACRLLPPGTREEALDEWIDEIETAAAEGTPVVRRTASIVLRALLRIAVTSRMPQRAQREKG